MKWFNNWFAKKSREAWENHRKAMEPQPMPIPTNWNNSLNALGKLSHPVPQKFSIDSTNFSIHRAVGGFIIEIKTYDLNSDKCNIALHIVPSTEDLGEAIGKIITYEALKN